VGGLSAVPFVTLAAAVAATPALQGIPFTSNGFTRSSGLQVVGGAVHVSGQFTAYTDFDPGPGYFILSPANGNIFVLKLTTAGALTSVAQVGSADGAGLVVVPTGAYSGIYLGGYFSGTADFDPGPGTLTVTSGSDSNGYVAKLGLDNSAGWAFGIGDTADTVRTIDDGGPGYSEVGSGWQSVTGGWGGHARTHAKGSGSNKAIWTFANLPNGTYHVVTQFGSAKKNASNAPFRVNGTLRTVNQQKVPNDFQFPSDGVWEDLGTVTVTNGTVTVELSDAANGEVIADAVRIWFESP
jgi:hypothetical protein